MPGAVIGNFVNRFNGLGPLSNENEVWNFELTEPNYACLPASALCGNISNNF